MFYLYGKLHVKGLRDINVNGENMYIRNNISDACSLHHYLWGTRFTIVTDHQPLVSIFKRKTKFPRMNRWILEMREYQYNIQFVKGKHNHVADSLSRPVLVIQHPPEAFRQGKSREEIRALQMEEDKWKEMIQYIEGGKIPRKRYPRAILDQFAVWEGVLYLLFYHEKGWKYPFQPCNPPAP